MAAGPVVAPAVARPERVTTGTGTQHDTLRLGQSQGSPALALLCALGAACVMIGVYWDISWHMSIGRDSFWTPAHLLIQAGGLIAGISSGYVAIRTTFFGSQAERDASVSFWGFRAPLGAWICVWGCGAMLTSAPFDNWWHNAYGLDVKIISPPHALLALGIYAIVVGALLLTLAQQNRSAGDDRKRFAWILAITGGFFIMNFSLFLTEYSERHMMHSPIFFEIVSFAFPFALASMARAIKLRWAATAAAAFFTATSLLLMWTIQLFPATPKLADTSSCRRSASISCSIESTASFLVWPSDSSSASYSWWHSSPHSGPLRASS